MSYEIERSGPYEADREDAISPRNSDVREAAAPAIDTVMGRFHEVFPRVTANQFSTAGFCASAAMSLATSRNSESTSLRRRFVHAVGLGLAALADAGDGSLARITGTASAFGARLDAAYDRLSGTGMALSRGAQARKRGSWIGEGLAYSAGITGHRPSKKRAEREMDGDVVEERPGKGRSLPYKVLVFPGTALGRQAVAVVTTSFPKLQPAGDAWTVAGNLAVAHDRRHNALALDVLPVEKRREARLRRRDMERLEGLAVIASIGLAIGMRQLEKRKKLA